MLYLSLALLSVRRLLLLLFITVQCSDMPGYGMSFSIPVKEDAVLSVGMDVYGIRCVYRKDL